MSCGSDFRIWANAYDRWDLSEDGTAIRVTTIIPNLKIGHEKNERIIMENCEFTDEQLRRLDDVQQAAYEFLSVLAETKHKAQDKIWDLNDIWDLIYEGSDMLTKRGFQVRIPTHVTTSDGEEYITDWYEKEDKIAMPKEQEAVEPTLVREAWNKYYNYYVCPHCRNEIVYEQNYCS